MNRVLPLGPLRLVVPPLGPLRLVVTWLLGPQAKYADLIDAATPSPYPPA